jgi:TatD DNase family protein
MTQKNDALKKYIDEIDKMLTQGKEKFVMIGECGLDYDRLEFANKEAQHLAFTPHFDLAEKHKLPMYLHSRSTGQDFNEIVK